MSTLEIVAQSFAMFGAAYPSSRKIDESTVRVWHAGLEPFSDDRVKHATTRWIHNEPYYPNLPKFIDMVRSEPVPESEEWHSDPLCVVCDDGWVEVNTDGPGTVAPCPNGCQTPDIGTIRDDDLAPAADFGWFAAVRDARAKSEAERQSIGADAFVVDRGFDPERFYVKDGMILAKVKPRPKPRKLGKTRK